MTTSPETSPLAVDWSFFDRGNADDDGIAKGGYHYSDRPVSVELNEAR